jgi:integrase
LSTTRKALTRQELGLLLAAVPDDWRLFFDLLTVTGLRISEQIGLRWAHVDLGEHPHLEIRDQFYRGKRKRLKSGAGRRDIPLSPSMADRLLRHRRDIFKGGDSPVFPSTVGTPLIQGKVRTNQLANAAIAVGLYEEVEGKDGKSRKRSTVGFQTFRHTCASMLFDEGRNIKQVQTWLGHADPAFTLRTYVHLLDSGVGEGLEPPARVNTGSTGGTETAESAQVGATVEGPV